MNANDFIKQLGRFFGFAPAKPEYVRIRVSSKGVPSLRIRRTGTTVRFGERSILRNVMVHRLHDDARFVIIHEARRK
jgi:hypothetical protein